jgi:hypothetical protein
MVEFVETSILDLARSTQFLHVIKPDLKDKLVYAIEKAQPFDRNVVFHLIPRKKEDGERSNDDSSIFMIASEYILEHPFWKGVDNDAGGS